MNIQTIPQTKSAWFMAQLNKALETGDDAFLTKQMNRFEQDDNSDIAWGILRIAQANPSPLVMFIDCGLTENLIDQGVAIDAISKFHSA